MTRIADLKDGMQRIDVKGEIVELGDERKVNTSQGVSRVSEALLKDDSGTIKLSLWGDQIDKVKKLDVVQVKTGYVNSFRGEIRLNVGRYGTLAVVGKSESPKSTVQMPITPTEEWIREIVDARLHELGLDENLPQSKQEEEIKR